MDGEQHGPNRPAAAWLSSIIPSKSMEPVEVIDVVQHGNGGFRKTFVIARMANGFTVADSVFRLHRISGPGEPYSLEDWYAMRDQDAKDHPVGIALGGLGRKMRCEQISPSRAAKPLRDYEACGIE